MKILLIVCCYLIWIISSAEAYKLERKETDNKDNERLDNLLRDLLNKLEDEEKRPKHDEKSNESGEKKKPTAAIFGGGPGGLTAAMELKEAGFEVQLFEKEKSLGGKMRGFVNKYGYPQEHSIRIYSIKYFALGDVFNRTTISVPNTHQEDFTSEFELIALSIVGTSSGLTVDPVAIAGKIINELQFSLSEYEYLVTQVAAWKTVPANVVNTLYDVPFKDFIQTGFAFDYWQSVKNCPQEGIHCTPEHTPNFMTWLEALIGLIVAGKMEDSTPGVMWIFQSIFYTSVDPTTEQCKDYYHWFQGSYLASGPTSPTIIEPWVAHIQNQGVKLKTNTELIRLEMNGSRVKKAVVRKNSKGKKQSRSSSRSSSSEEKDEKEIKADVYVLALPVDDAEDIVPGITHGRASSITWSSSFQFYLPCLPQEWEFIRGVKGYAAIWDSTYEIVFMLQSPEDGFWHQQSFALNNGIEYVLSVAFSEFFKPGTNGKTFIESTRDEALNELLNQIAFPDSTTITCQRDGQDITYDRSTVIESANAGLLLLDLEDEEYQEYKDGKYKTAGVGPVKSDGKRWCLTAPLYLPTPQNKPIPTTTDRDNLFLAGTYVATPLLNMPTMEHAAESGKFAAQAAIESMGLTHRVPQVDKLLQLVGATTIKEYADKVQAGEIQGYC